MVKQKERATSPERLKHVNAALVYRLIDRHGPISRVSIAQHCTPAPASITNITRQLLDHQLITEVAQQASTGGRPAISLTTNQHGFHFISCRLGRDVIQCSAMDLSGQSIDGQQMPIQHHDMPSIVNMLRKMIMHLLTKCGTHRFVAIAITMAGLVDPASA
ncbi:hypothetical protein P4S72_20785 [Vibrio sp. PP-XX7]